MIRNQELKSIRKNRGVKLSGIIFDINSKIWHPKSEQLCSQIELQQKLNVKQYYQERGDASSQMRNYLQTLCRKVDLYLEYIQLSNKTISSEINED